MSKETFEEYKQSLVELVEWYRDEYHKKDFGHNKMIEEISKARDPRDLETHERILDFWLDY